MIQGVIFNVIDRSVIPKKTEAIIILTGRYILINLEGKQ